MRSHAVSECPLYHYVEYFLRRTFNSCCCRGFRFGVSSQVVYEGGIGESVSPVLLICRASSLREDRGIVCGVDWYVNAVPYQFICNVELVRRRDS